MTEERKAPLKIFLGYAAGVGKTYKMLEEAQALKAQGQDVVIGYLETHDRPDTQAKAVGLEVVPRKQIQQGGQTGEEMDADGILERHPRMAVVDELRHTNAPGSKRKRRWEDVMVLLDAGIGVMTTLDIQHLESLNDEIQNITGMTVEETVPDWLIQRADEVVMVDLTPRALLNRLQRGVICKERELPEELQHLFHEPTLVALRELALREAAHEVEQRSESEGEAGQPQEQRILVYLTEDPKTAMVTRRARRVSDFLGVQCFAVAVQSPGGANGSSPGDREAIERHVNFARNLHIETRVLEGKDPAAAVIDFARKNQVTQIFVARPRSGVWPSLLSRDPVHKMIDLAKDMQVVIVSDRDPVKK